MANPILYGDINRLPTKTPITTDLLLIGDVTQGDLNKATVASVVAIGALATTGTVTLNGATPVTVTNSAVTANSQIIFTLKTVGGTVGAYPAIQTITASTGFTVAGTALDTSVYNFVIIG